MDEKCDGIWHGPSTSHGLDLMIITFKKTPPILIESRLMKRPLDTEGLRMTLCLPHELP